MPREWKSRSEPVKITGHQFNTLREVLSEQDGIRKNPLTATEQATLGRAACNLAQYDLDVQLDSYSKLSQGNEDPDYYASVYVAIAAAPC
jgi:hypothetical protein